MPVCMNNEGVQPSGLGSQNKETAPVHNFENILSIMVGELFCLKLFVLISITSYFI